MLLGVGLFAAYMLQPPSPLPANAPATQFSAYRAIEYNRGVASVPHPAGSPANEKTQQYIYDQLKSMGVAAEINSSLFVRGHSCGQANLVLARIPGTANTKAFAMEAHYDSVPYGPGASDDCGGVAAMLEIARALKAGPPLKNDIVFVFADAEECGMMGARAFTEHAWFADVGVMLCFEARGNAGPAFMFETSPDNGWMIRQLAASGVPVAASSMMFDVYKRMPFNSDFSVYKRAGVHGMNLAFIDHFCQYHTKNDNPDNFNLASLQNHGAIGLGLAKRLGNVDLIDVTAPDAMYSNVIGRWIVCYPLSWGVPLALLTALVFLVVMVFGLIRRHLTVPGILGGFLAFVGAIVCAMLTAAALLALVFGPEKFYSLYTKDFTHLPDLIALNHSDLYVYAFGAGAVAAVVLFYGVLLRFVRMQNLAAGALLGWLAVLAGVTVFLPGGSYMVQWPLLFASIGLGLLFLAPDPDEVSPHYVAALAVFAMPGLLLLAPAFQAFAYTVMVIAGPFEVVILVFLISLLLPQLAVITRRNLLWLPVLSACLAAAMIAYGLASSSYTSLRPKLDSVAYGLNLDTGKACWMSEDSVTDEWTSQFFPAGTPREPVDDFYPGFKRPVLRASAPVAPLQGPDLKAVSDAVKDGIRELVLRVSSNPKPASLELDVTSDTEVFSASVFDKPLDGGKGRWGVRFHLFPDKGGDLTLRVSPNAPLEIKVREQFYGMPDVPGIRPRPDYMAPEPNTVHRRYGVRDGHIWVTRTFTFPTT